MEIVTDGLLTEDQLKRIAITVRSSRVTIISGMTGIGKSTLIPMELGKHNNVWVSQPRRISVLNSFYLVHDVYKFADSGYKIRFSQFIPPGQRKVIFATDGETIQYIGDIRDTLIVDEAHERNAIQDIIIALARKRLEMGELRHLVIQSATMNIGEFMEYFWDLSPALIEIKGKRRFNVETRYNGNITDLREIHEKFPLEYRVLIFRPGLSDIERTASLIPFILDDNRFEIITLHSQISDIQTFQRVIRPPERVDRREIIIATNIAEASITPSHCVAVFDDGYQKRVEYVNGLFMLRRTRISKSSAIQRAGRVGRTMDGIIIREYSLGDYMRFPDRDTPEILRIPAVNLVYRLLGYGTRLEQLDLMDSPPPEIVERAYRWLMLYGFVSDKRELTETGRLYTEFPDDPRLARILHNIIHGDYPRWFAPVLTGGLLFIMNNVMKIGNYHREIELLDIPEAMLYFAEFWSPGIDDEYQFANSLLNSRKRVAKERGLILNKAEYSVSAMYQLMEYFKISVPEITRENYVKTLEMRTALSKMIKEDPEGLVKIIANAISGAFPVYDLTKEEETSKPKIINRHMSFSRFAKPEFLFPSREIFVIGYRNIVTRYGLLTVITKWHPVI